METNNERARDEDAATIAFGRIAERWRARQERDVRARNSGTLETMTAPAFRAIVAERLRGLEREMMDVRSRVNGLLFVVAGAVITQVVLRLFG